MTAATSRAPQARRRSHRIGDSASHGPAGESPLQVWGRGRDLLRQSRSRDAVDRVLAQIDLAALRPEVLQEVAREMAEADAHPTHALSGARRTGTGAHLQQMTLAEFRRRVWLCHEAIRWIRTEGGKQVRALPRTWIDCGRHGDRRCKEESCGHVQSRPDVLTCGSRVCPTCGLTAARENRRGLRAQVDAYMAAFSVAEPLAHNIGRRVRVHLLRSSDEAAAEIAIEGVVVSDDEDDIEAEGVPAGSPLDGVVRAVDWDSNWLRYEIETDVGKRVVYQGVARLERLDDGTPAIRRGRRRDRVEPLPLVIEGIVEYVEPLADAPVLRMPAGVHAQMVTVTVRRTDLITDVKRLGKALTKLMRTKLAGAPSLRGDRPAVRGRLRPDCGASWFYDLAPGSNGFGHLHAHGLFIGPLLSAVELSREWSRITGDSHVVRVDTTYSRPRDARTDLSAKIDEIGGYATKALVRIDTTRDDPRADVDGTRRPSPYDDPRYLRGRMMSPWLVAMYEIALQGTRRVRRYGALARPLSVEVDSEDEDGEPDGMGQCERCGQRTVPRSDGPWLWSSDWVAARRRQDPSYVPPWEQPRVRAGPARVGPRYAAGSPATPFQVKLLRLYGIEHDPDVIGRAEASRRIEWYEREHPEQREKRRALRAAE